MPDRCGIDTRVMNITAAIPSGDVPDASLKTEVETLTSRQVLKEENTQEICQHEAQLNL